MKYTIYTIMLCVVPALCFSQNELKVDVSFLKETQILLITVKNESSKSFGIFNGRIGTNEFDGSVVYLRKNQQSPVSGEGMFLLIEYDKKADILKEFHPMSWINPYEEKYFGINLKNKRNWLSMKDIFVTIDFSVRLIKEKNIVVVVKSKRFETFISIL